MKRTLPDLSHPHLIQIIPTFIPVKPSGRWPRSSSHWPLFYVWLRCQPKTWPQILSLWESRASIMRHPHLVNPHSHCLWPASALILSFCPLSTQGTKLRALCGGFTKDTHAPSAPCLEAFLGMWHPGEAPEGQHSILGSCCLSHPSLPVLQKQLILLLGLHKTVSLILSGSLESQLSLFKSLRK